MNYIRKSSEKLSGKITKWQEKNKKLKVRFIKPDNLHLTLIPPWYEENTELPVALLKQIQFGECELVFDKFNVNFKNKVIWIESSNPPVQIFKLLKSLRGMFPHGNQTGFKAHITVARFKDGKKLEDIKFKAIGWRERVNKITLFESVLGRKGANYKILFQV